MQCVACFVIYPLVSFDFAPATEAGDDELPGKLVPSLQTQMVSNKSGLKGCGRIHFFGNARGGDLPNNMCTFLQIFKFRGPVWVEKETHLFKRLKVEKQKKMPER